MLTPVQTGDPGWPPWIPPAEGDSEAVGTHVRLV